MNLVGAAITKALHNNKRRRSTKGQIRTTVLFIIVPCFVAGVILIAVNYLISSDPIIPYKSDKDEVPYQSPD
jgi:hypothetical protein